MKRKAPLLAFLFLVFLFFLSDFIQISSAEPYSRKKRIDQVEKEISNAPFDIEQWLTEIEDTIPQKLKSYFKVVLPWLGLEKALESLHNIQMEFNSPDIVLQRHRPSCGTYIPRAKKYLRLLAQAKLSSACPSASFLDCKSKLHQIFQNESFIPPHILPRDFAKYAQMHPEEMWIVKRQRHGHTFVGKAIDVAKDIEDAPHEEGIVTKLLDNPWLFEGKFVTSMRVYVVVTNQNPLRIFVATSLRFPVAFEPYNQSNPCALITNIGSPTNHTKHCRLTGKSVILDWQPLDNSATPQEDPDYECCRVAHVDLPEKLWRNILRLVRKVFARVAKESYEKDNWSKKRKGSRCGSIWGLDLYLHDNFEVSLLEANSLPTLPESEIYVQLAREYLWLFGGKKGHRERYVDTFRRVIRSLCQEPEKYNCTRTRLQNLLDLSDERWAFGVKMWKPIFPASHGLDEDILRVYGNSHEELEMTAEFLRRMGATDDYDFSLPTKFLWRENEDFPAATINYAVGSEDPRTAHIPIIQSIIKEMTSAEERNFLALVVAGSGDPLLGWYPIAIKEIENNGWTENFIKGDNKSKLLSVYAVDVNQQQVEISIAKFQSLLLGTEKEISGLMFGEAVEGTQEENREKFLEQILLSHPKLNTSKSYWLSNEMTRQIVYNGLIGLDKPRQVHGKELDMFRQEQSGCQGNTSTKRERMVAQSIIEDEDLVRHIVIGPFDRMACFMDIVSNIPRYMKAINPSGWPIGREIGRRWLEACKKFPSSWYCKMYLRTNLYPDQKPIGPPWLLNSANGIKLSDNTWSSIKFRQMHISTALKKVDNESVSFIDLSNVASFLPVDSVSEILELAEQKMSRKFGVMLLFIGAARTGVCLQTGGDMQACKEFIIRLADEKGLVVHPRWVASLENLIGESSTTYFVLPLIKKKNF